MKPMLWPAAVAQSVVQNQCDLLGQERKQEPEQHRPEAVGLPGSLGEETIESGVVLRTGGATSCLNHTSDAVATLASDPASDQGDEVLKTRSRKAGREANQERLNA